MMENQSNTSSRIGERGFNSNGTSMEIIRYNGCEDITVLFDGGYMHETTYGNFKKGKVRNYYDKTVYNVGYIGVGKHKTQTSAYHCWHNMIKIRNLTQDMTVVWLMIFGTTFRISPRGGKIITMKQMMR